MKKSNARFAWVAAAALMLANAPADDSSGSIVVYRGTSVMGFAVACPVRYKGRNIVELGRGRKATFIVAPGRYILNNKGTSVEVNVAPGETRFVRCEVKSGSTDLQIVDEESYAAAEHSLRDAAPAQRLN